MKRDLVIGIDEAGRGPLAGPVSVGAVLISKFHYHLFKGVRDSKKLSEVKREEWFLKIKEAAQKGILNYSVSLTEARTIDKKGIVPSIRSALFRAIGKLSCNPEEVEVLLDGGLRAPERFIYQKTIIGGDDKEIPISLASIVAKVSRDKFMKRIAGRFPTYSFEIHKGYGTLSHREKIIKYGPSSLHRTSFLKNLNNKI